MNAFQKINIPRTLFLQVKEPLRPLIACQAAWPWKSQTSTRTAHVKAQIIQWSNSDQGAHKRYRMQCRCSAWEDGLAARDPCCSESASWCVFFAGFFLFWLLVSQSTWHFTYKCPKVARDTVQTKMLLPFSRSLQGESNCDLKERENMHQK